MGNIPSSFSIDTSYHSNYSDIPAERPKTARARRGDASFRDEFESSETPRPRTARGTRYRSQQSVDESTTLSDSLRESGYLSAAGKSSVDILKLDDDGEEIISSDNNNSKLQNSRSQVMQTMQKSSAVDAPRKTEQVWIKGHTSPVFVQSPPVTDRSIQSDHPAFSPSPPLTARKIDSNMIRRRSSVISGELCASIL